MSYFHLNNKFFCGGVYEEKNDDEEFVSSITRLFDEDGRASGSEVEIAGGLYRAPQHYKVSYERVYF